MVVMEIKHNHNPENILKSKTLKNLNGINTSKIAKVVRAFHHNLMHVFEDDYSGINLAKQQQDIQKEHLDYSLNG